MKRERLTKRLPRRKSVWGYALEVGNCSDGEELVVGMSMLAQDRSVICHIHLGLDTAVAVYRDLGEAIMHAGTMRAAV